MDIRAADATSFDLDHHFLRSRCGDRILADLETRMLPDLAAEIGLSSFDIFPAEFKTRLWIPICDQGHPWHCAFHDVFSFCVIAPAAFTGVARRVFCDKAILAYIVNSLRK